jgi:CRP-like cAMP-binding protein
VLLLRLAERFGRPEAGGSVRIELPLSQDDLAGLVLTTRRTVGRVLELWRQRGWVRTGRRYVVLLDPAALGRLAAR